MFDIRRGQREGDEADKILAFHPSAVNLNLQKGFVGFAEAAIAFSSTFSKVLNVMRLETPQHLNSFFAEASPDPLLPASRRANRARELLQSTSVGP